jgi:oxygen-independent coproporphyrinogen-3 oxidase
MVFSQAKELRNNRDFFNGHSVETIYFGGGTPSIIKTAQVADLLRTIFELYPISSDVEITLEANPDDIQDSGTLQRLYDEGINRLSLGIQSFNDAALEAMNRAHNSTMTWSALDLIHNSPFSNYTVDLIYSLPFLSEEEFRRDLETIISIKAPHVSTYSLTIEEKTVFGHQAAKGLLTELQEDSSAFQFELILSELTQLGYRNYEISNFGIPGFESRHNMNYWHYGPYLGIGPGAHSFDGVNRRANVRNNALYIKGIMNDKPNRELITLTPIEKANEYLLTSLRTDTGTSLKILNQIHDINLLNIHSARIMEMQKNGLLYLGPDNLLLTEKGKLLADQIAMDLFFEE